MFCCENATPFCRWFGFGCDSKVLFEDMAPCIFYPFDIWLTWLDNQITFSKLQFSCWICFFYVINLISQLVKMYHFLTFLYLEKKNQFSFLSVNDWAINNHLFKHQCHFSVWKYTKLSAWGHLFSQLLLQFSFSALIYARNRR